MAIVEYRALQGEQRITSALDSRRQALACMEDRLASSRVRYQRYKPAVFLLLGANQAVSRSHVLICSAFIHFDVQAFLQQLFLMPDLALDMRATSEHVLPQIMYVQPESLEMAFIY